MSDEIERTAEQQKHFNEGFTQGFAEGQEQGEANGFAQGQAKWNWEQYFAGIFMTILGIAAILFILVGVWKFIHWASDHTMESQGGSNNFHYCTTTCNGTACTQVCN